MERKMTLILASSSPRRQELIRMLGLPVRIVVSHADETVEEGTAPAAMVEQLALRKAEAVNELLKSQSTGTVRDTASGLAEEDGSGIIIGADTIVVLNGVVYGKPADEEDAFRMLKLLQGAVHQVYTGIACIDRRSGRLLVRNKKTDVTLQALTDAQIRRYIATGEPMDKAGSYAAQGFGATFVDRIDGDYYSVVGLSLNLLSGMLAEFDIALP
ncbi:Maf family protein [Paenibacillus sp. MBLB4367]|uniref:Maf family protein n=1 Tax=Paenibacillus sp. MBLB4367 TaxID=3384767 RepID=UPI003907EE59